jgi:hypothetical protein
MDQQHSNEEPVSQDDTDLTGEEHARREFLKKAGRFAAVTPPAITFLLGTTLGSRAIAASSGTRPGHGWGDSNHSHSGPPGRNR